MSDGVIYIDNFMQKHLYKRLDTKVSGAIYKMLQHLVAFSFVFLAFNNQFYLDFYQLFDENIRHPLYGELMSHA